MNNEKITEQIELLTELMNVKSSVKGNVTSDYTLAFLGKTEREFITENYQNAEFAKEIINRFKKGYTYEFDNEKGEWKTDEYHLPKKISLKKEDQNIIDERAKRIFEFFMIQPHMIAILNRNKMDNFMVKGYFNQKDEEEPITFGKDDRSILQKIKDKFGGNDDQDED